MDALQGVDTLQSGGVQAQRRAMPMLAVDGQLALALASYAHLRGAAFKLKHEGGLRYAAVTILMPAKHTIFAQPLLYIGSTQRSP